MDFLDIAGKWAFMAVEKDADNKTQPEELTGGEICFAIMFFGAPIWAWLTIFILSALS